MSVAALTYAKPQYLGSFGNLRSSIVAITLGNSYPNGASVGFSVDAVALGLKGTSGPGTVTNPQGSLIGMTPVGSSGTSAASARSSAYDFSYNPTTGRLEVSTGGTEIANAVDLSGLTVTFFCIGL